MILFYETAAQCEVYSNGPIRRTPWFLVKKKKLIGKVRYF